MNNGLDISELDAVGGESLPMVPHEQVNASHSIQTSLDILKQYAVIATPLVIDNLIIMSSGFFNNIFYSKLEKDDLAASALISSYQSVILVGMYGALHMLQPMYVEAMQSHKKYVGNIFRSGMVYSGLLCIPMMSILFFSGSLLKLFGVDSNLADVTNAFLRVFMWAVPGILTLDVQAQLYIACNRPYYNIPVSFTKLTLQIVFSWLLLDVLNMGMAGIASAAVVGTYTTNILNLLFLYKSNYGKELGLFVKSDVKNNKIIKELLKKSLPIFIERSAEVGAGLATSIILARLGNNALRASQISSGYIDWYIAPLVSIPSAAAVIIARQRNQINLYNLRKVANIGLAMGLVISLAAIPIFTLLSKPLTSLYIDVDSPDNQIIVSNSKITFTCMSLILPFFAITRISAGSLLGLKETMLPFLFGVFGVWVIGFCFAVLSEELGWGLIGVASAPVLGRMFTASSTWGAWMWKSNREINRGDISLQFRSKLFPPGDTSYRDLEKSSHASESDVQTYDASSLRIV